MTTPLKPLLCNEELSSPLDLGACGVLASSLECKNVFLHKFYAVFPFSKVHACYFLCCTHSNAIFLELNPSLSRQSTTLQ